MKQSYIIMVSVPAENTTDIYNHTSPLVPQLAPMHLTMHGQHYICYKNVFTSCRRRLQDIPRSPSPRCTVVASRTIDMQPLPYNRDCSQASLVLRGWVWYSHHSAGGNLLSYLFVGVLLQNSKLHQVNAESKTQLVCYLLRLL
jgi:hypothetical protein